LYKVEKGLGTIGKGNANFAFGGERKEKLNGHSKQSDTTDPLQVGYQKKIWKIKKTKGKKKKRLNQTKAA